MLSLHPHVSSPFLFFPGSFYYVSVWLIDHYVDYLSLHFSFELAHVFRFVFYIRFLAVDGPFLVLCLVFLLSRLVLSMCSRVSCVLGNRFYLQMRQFRFRVVLV